MLNLKQSLYDIGDGEVIRLEFTHPEYPSFLYDCLTDKEEEIEDIRKEAEYALEIYKKNLN